MPYRISQFLLLACIPVVGVCLPGLGSAQTTELEIQLKPFEMKEGGFRILLPGQPIHDKVEVAGPGVQHQFRIGTNDGVYLVSYQDNPNLEGADEDALFAALRLGQDGAARAFGGEVIESRVDKLNDTYPGLQFRASIPQANGEARCRFFLVNTRLYQVMALGVPEFVHAAQAQQVLDSFELLP